MPEVIDLQRVRSNKEWVRNAKVLSPIMDAVEQAVSADKRVELFRAACRFRELIATGTMTSRGAWWLLRAAAGLKMPIDERDRTISAGLYKSRLKQA